MTVAGATQRTYTPEDKAQALMALDLNKGYVRPTADMIGLPQANLDRWKDRRDAAVESARAALSETTKVKTLADTFLKLAQAGADHALATLDKASPYHGALISAISLDKWALITGRPTSRTEVLRARYVEPASLRSLSSSVIDVEASPQRVRGVGDGAAPSHLPAGQKAKRRTKKKITPQENLTPGTP
jgi:hypothetical protein